MHKIITVGNASTIGWLATLCFDTIAVKPTGGPVRTLQYHDDVMARRAFDKLITQYSDFGLSKIEAYLTKESTT